jgi:NADP-dependent 3-hydroxy acid dehydrogenase YdfG
MIVSITGHTKGLGNHIFKSLSENHNVIGLSTSNGYDIKDTDTIIDSIKDSEVFINNAYFKDCQSILFERLFGIWKDTNKLIININSSIVNETTIDDNLIEYHSYKSQFKKIVNDTILNNPNKKVRIMNIYPSTLESNYFYSGLNKIDNNYIASLINWVVEQTDNVEMRDVVIYPAQIHNTQLNNII